MTIQLTDAELALFQKLASNPELLTALTQKQAGKTYNCTSCDYSIVSEKNKRKCPKCKTFIMKEVSTTSKPTQTPAIEQSTAPKDHVTQTRGQSQSEDGEGRPCRREPVDLNRIKNNMQFIDDGSHKNDSKEFDKKVIFNPTQRREPFKLVNKQCVQCGKTQKINPAFSRPEWRCDNCIRIGERE